MRVSSRSSSSTMVAMLCVLGACSEASAPFDDFDAMDGADCAGLPPSKGLAELEPVFESEPMVTIVVKCTTWKKEEAQQNKNGADGSGAYQTVWGSTEHEQRKDRKRVGRAVSGLVLKREGTRAVFEDGEYRICSPHITSSRLAPLPWTNGANRRGQGPAGQRTMRWQR